MREAYENDPNGKLTCDSVTPEILEVAQGVAEKRIRDLDEVIDDPDAFTQLVTDEEWLVLGADELNQEELK